jgi:hypothetical protein
MTKQPYIKMQNLKEGYLYRINARNARYGIWIPEHQAFATSRIKFGDNFIFEEFHWDCESFATAKPLEELEKSPFTLKHLEETIFKRNGVRHVRYRYGPEVLSYLNKFEGERDYLGPAWRLEGKGKS